MAHQSPTEPPNNEWLVAPIRGAVGSATLVRELNERMLLDLLRSGPTSRVDLANQTGLSKPTVSTALANLERYGLVVEAGSETGKRGPAAVIYRADPSVGYVMSIDVGRSWVRLAIADLAGAIVVRLDRPNRSRSAPTLAKAIIELVKTAAHQAHIPMRTGASFIEVSPIEVTVIGGPGTFDPNSRTVRVAGGLAGWGQPHFLDSLESLLPGEVVIENDINLATVGEHTTGSAMGRANFVLVSIGTGLGCGIIINNQLFRGASGLAGEIGFLPIGEGHIAKLRPSRTDHARGVFEEQAAADAIVRIAREEGIECVDARAVFDSAASGNKSALRTLRRVGALIGAGVATIAALFDPEIIVITGGVGANLEVLRCDITTAAQNFIPFVPEIIAGSLGDAAVLQGGIVTALPLARERVFVRRSRQD